MAPILFAVIGGLILFMVIRVAVTAPGRSLASKFRAAGTLKGLTKDEIVAKVGRPNSVSAQAGGKSLLQWQATGYHIALRFDPDGVCEGVTHQHSARR